jgi:hypothetical protein
MGAKEVGRLASSCGMSKSGEWAEYLSIDPGEYSGWALWNGNRKLMGCGTGESPVKHPMKGIVVELPLNYPGSPVPSKDLVTLAFTAGRLVGSIETEFLRTVFPREWKGQLPKNICAQRVRDHLSEDETRLVDQCAHCVGKGELHNIMDAIGIGLVVFRGARL